MSTGQKTRGDPNSFEYAIKTWNGGNSASHKVECNYTMSSSWWLREPYIIYWVHGGVAYSGKSQHHDSTMWHSWSSNDELKVLSKLVNQIRGHDFNLGIVVAEGLKTIGSIKDTALAVLGAFYAVRHGRLDDALRIFARVIQGADILKKNYTPSKLSLKDIADMWLALKYAWQPLLQDIFELGKALDNNFKDVREVTFVARATATSTSSNGIGNYPTFWERSAKREYRVIVKENISVARSLGLQNPASVIWEVVPYSFVVDWFIPIGSYLDDLGLLSNLSKTVNRTTVYRSKCRARSTPCRTNGIWTGPHDSWCCPSSPYAPLTYHNGWTVHGMEIQMSRETNVSLNVPFPRFKSLEQAFGLAHIQNAAALIGAAMSRARGH